MISATNRSLLTMMRKMDGTYLTDDDPLLIINLTDVIKLFCKTLAKHHSKTRVVFRCDWPWQDIYWILIGLGRSLGQTDWPQQGTWPCPGSLRCLGNPWGQGGRRRSICKWRSDWKYDPANRDTLCVCVCVGCVCVCVCVFGHCCSLESQTGCLFSSLVSLWWTAALYKTTHWH